MLRKKDDEMFWEICDEEREAGETVFVNGDQLCATIGCRHIAQPDQKYCGECRGKTNDNE